MFIYQTTTANHIFKHTSWLNTIFIGFYKYRTLSVLWTRYHECNHKSFIMCLTPVFSLCIMVKGDG